MKMLSKDHRIFSMSQDHAPALTIVSGEMVRVETCDCFSDAIRTEDDLVLHIDFEEVNPATGPIFIRRMMLVGRV